MKDKYTAKNGEKKINGVLVNPGFMPPAKPLKKELDNLIAEIESYERKRKIAEGWSNSIPRKEGLYYMRDEGGGPTLYIFKIINGVMMCGPKSRYDDGKDLWEVSCMLSDAEFLAV